VYAISDLHTDHPANLRWLEGLAPPPWRGPAAHTNVLLVAGDISHDLGLIRRSLQLLRASYDRVLFVAGNHECWVRDREAGTHLLPAQGGKYQVGRTPAHAPGQPCRRACIADLQRHTNDHTLRNVAAAHASPGSTCGSAGPTVLPQVKGDEQQRGGAADSVAKLEAVHALCRELRVDTQPLRLGRLWIAPVLSWHHKVGLVGAGRGPAPPRGGSAMACREGRKTRGNGACARACMRR
jgi:hypothetical protein